MVIQNLDEVEWKSQNQYTTWSLVSPARILCVTYFQTKKTHLDFFCKDQKYSHMCRCMHTLDSPHLAIIGLKQFALRSSCWTTLTKCWQLVIGLGLQCMDGEPTMVKLLRLEKAWKKPSHWICPLGGYHREFFQNGLITKMIFTLIGAAPPRIQSQEDIKTGFKDNLL